MRRRRLLHRIVVNHLVTARTTRFFLRRGVLCYEMLVAPEPTHCSIKLRIARRAEPHWGESSAPSWLA